MKTLKNYLFAASIVVTMAACSNDMKEAVDTAVPTPVATTGLKYMEFTASAGADTRTQLTDDNKVVWVNGDAISIFDGTANRRFTTKDNGASAIFGGEAKETNTYYALYPYQEGATIQGSLIKNVTIPVVQEAKAGSFDGGNNISVASASTDLQLAFKNVGSLVKFSMTNDKASDVRTVKLTSNGGNAVLAGTVNISVGATPTITAVSAQSQVTLKSDTGFEKDKDYYFTVLPGTLSNGFSLTFTDKDNKTWQKTYTAEANMNRSNILKLNDIELGNFTTGLLSNVNLIAAAEASTGQVFTKNADGTVSLLDATNLEIANSVTEIDVTDKNDATVADELSFFTGLKVLRCSGNNIESLDLSGNLVLEELYCYGTEHFENYVNEDEHGESLGWDGTLKQVNIASNMALKVLNVMGNQLTSIDLSDNTALTHLWVNDNYNLGSLDISNNTALVYLNAGSDGLSEIDITNNTLLKELYISDNNPLSIIGLSNLVHLERLECNSDGLTSLDVTNNKALRILACAYQSISELDLSQNLMLKTLECRCNEITSIDVSQNSELVDLSVAVNKLTAIDVSYNTKLKVLQLGTNNLSSLDVLNNTELEYMDCDNNFLTSLDLSNNPKLSGLITGVNLMSSLDISKTSLRLDAIQVGGQSSNQGDDIVLNLYVNAYQYNSTGELKREGNENVNIVLKSDATHEGYNESNYGG